MKYSAFGFLLGCTITSSAKAAPLGSDIKKISDKTLTLVSTAKDAEDPFQSSEVPWSSPGQEPKFPTLIVDRTVSYQEIEGFGGAMTESRYESSLNPCDPCNPCHRGPCAPKPIRPPVTLHQERGRRFLKRPVLAHLDIQAHLTLCFNTSFVPYPLFPAVPRSSTRCRRTFMSR